MNDNPAAKLSPEHHALASELLQTAVDRTESPFRAVSLLMCAAATILQRHVGEEAALALMTQALDDTGAAWRARTAN